MKPEDNKNIPEIDKTTPLPSAKERVQQELNDLNEKIVKLTKMLYGEKFLDAKLSQPQLVLLEDQLRVMQTYASILQNRLAIWDPVKVDIPFHPYK